MTLWKPGGLVGNAEEATKQSPGGGTREESG